MGMNPTAESLNHVSKEPGPLAERFDERAAEEVEPNLEDGNVTLMRRNGTSGWNVV